MVLPYMRIAHVITLRSITSIAFLNSLPLSSSLISLLHNSTSMWFPTPSRETILNTYIVKYDSDTHFNNKFQVSQSSSVASHYQVITVRRNQVDLSGNFPVVWSLEPSLFYICPAIITFNSKCSLIISNLVRHNSLKKCLNTIYIYYIFLHLSFSSFLVDMITNWLSEKRIYCRLWFLLQDFTLR